MRLYLINKPNQIETLVFDTFTREWNSNVLSF